MAGDDAANKSILNEITILVSFYTHVEYTRNTYIMVLGEFNAVVNHVVDLQYIEVE